MIEKLPGLDGVDEGTRGTVVNHRIREVTQLAAGAGVGAGPRDAPQAGAVRPSSDPLAPDGAPPRDPPAPPAPATCAPRRVARAARTAPDTAAAPSAP